MQMFSFIYLILVSRGPASPPPPPPPPLKRPLYPLAGVRCFYTTQPPPRRCTEELPEKCLGVIRLVNLDLDGAEPLEHVNPASPSTPSLPEGLSPSEGEPASLGSRRAGRPGRSGAAGTEGPGSVAVGGGEAAAPSLPGRANATNA